MMYENQQENNTKISHRCDNPACKRIDKTVEELSQPGAELFETGIIVGEQRMRERLLQVIEPIPPTVVRDGEEVYSQELQEFKFKVLMFISADKMQTDRMDENEDHTVMINLSKEQLKARRTEILNILGLTHREYVRKEIHEGLEAKEWQYANELDAIDFLLEEDDVIDEDN